MARNPAHRVLIAGCTIACQVSLFSTCKRDQSIYIRLWTFLPVQMLPALSQINLLNQLHSSGSMMSYDSLRSQNRSQPEIQNLITTVIHQYISVRQALPTSETFSDTSGFGSAAISVGIIPRAQIPQKAQRLSQKKSRDDNGKFRASVEYPLSVKLGGEENIWKGQFQIPMAKSAHLRVDSAFGSRCLIKFGIIAFSIKFESFRQTVSLEQILLTILICA